MARTAKRQAPSPEPMSMEEITQHTHEYLRAQLNAAKAAASLMKSEGSAVGMLTQGVLMLCSKAYPKAISAKLVIDLCESREVELHLPVDAGVLGAMETYEPTPTPREVRARFRGWMARLLEELNLLEQAVLTDPTLKTAIPADIASDISLRAGEAWHALATTYTFDAPPELPQLNAK